MPVVDAVEDTAPSQESAQQYMLGGGLGGGGLWKGFRRHV